MKMQFEYKVIGENIRLKRAEAGWTQVELAKSVGLERTSIANIELGRQRILVHDVILFARIFGCRLSELIPDDIVSDDLVGPEGPKPAKLKTRKDFFLIEVNKRIKGHCAATKNFILEILKLK